MRWSGRVLGRGDGKPNLGLRAGRPTVVYGAGIPSEPLPNHNGTPGGRYVKGFRTHRPSRPFRPLLCVRARWAPVRRSRFSTRWGGSGIPSEPTPKPNARTIPRDRSCRIFRNASSHSGEIIRGISRLHAHCNIVRGLGPTSSVRDSCPTYLGRMLGLMSAEQITQKLGLFCSDRGSFGSGTHSEAV